MSARSAPDSRKNLRTPKILTFQQLWMLQNEAGYKLMAEDDNFFEWSRDLGFKKGRRTLDPTREYELVKILNRIVDNYDEPMFYKAEIIQRVRNITRTMSNTLESDFCWNWVSRNIDNL